MNLLFIFFTGFTIGISGAIIPGPFTFFTVSQALKTGKFAGLKTTAGHIVFELFMLLVIFFGFHEIFTHQVFLSFASIVGALAFIIMAVLLFINASTMKILGIKGDSGFDKGSFIGGIFFSAISPGFIIWWATIGFVTIVRVSLFGLVGIVVLIVGHWLADVLWYGFISYMVDKGKMYLSNKHYQNIVRFISVLLILLAFQILFMPN